MNTMPTIYSSIGLFIESPEAALWEPLQITVGTDSDITLEDPTFCEDRDNALYIRLEAVMNSMRNGLGMRKTGNRRRSGQPENPHSNAVFDQVHNTLLERIGN